MEGLAACDSQTASPFDCWNNCAYNYIYPLGDTSVQRGRLSTSVLLLQPLCKFLLIDLAVLALLLFLLRILAPRAERFLQDLSRANPREAAHVLTTIDFEQLVLCVTLHILPHSADPLAGAATAIEHAATIFRAAVNRERKISAAALQMRMEILCQTHPRREKSTSVMLASSAVWSRRLDLLMHSRQIALNVRQFPVWQKLHWIFCNPVSPVLIYRSIPATDRRNTDACPSKSSRSFCTRVYLKTALRCAKCRK